MSRFAVFLRGMNVGGHRLTNEMLKSHVTALGFAGVATFRASGNVVLEAGAGQDDASIRSAVEEGLREALGYEVPTYVRSQQEMLEMAALTPFEPDALPGASGKLQVAILSATPTAAVARSALAMAGERDLLMLSGPNLYWQPFGGILDTELDMKALSQLLGPFTVRTKGTIELLAAKHFAS
jgi:uncharacterized protein (DUF1697 family)